MLGCDKTVTVVRYEDEVYTKTILRGVSWHGKLKMTPEVRGLTATSLFTVRIPSDALPDGYFPKVGDVLALGEIRREITSPADLKPWSHFKALTVGDNRRGELAHVVVSGT